MHKIHPFESAGLGKAPFRCTHVTIGHTSCQYCGTPIRYQYWIRSVDGKEFYVGCDCVRKTYAEVANFKSVRRAFLSKQRDAQREARREARLAKWKAETAEKRKAFDAEHPGLADYLAARGKANSFLQSMSDNLRRFGSLTQNQLVAVERIIAESKQRDALAESSEHKGTVGKPYTGELVIQLVRSWNSNFYPYPAVYFHVMSDADGNVFVYKGSVSLGYKGETVAGTFTVKEHSEYQGTAQTVLTRPRNYGVVKNAEGIPCS